MRSEFEFIHNLKKKYTLNAIGDDCAVLPKDNETELLITADMLVEDIDFRLEWRTPEFLGHKSLAVSLSDIAAMGGKPVWSMVSLGVPDVVWKSDFVDRFYEGWFALAHKYDIELVGGDISRSPDKLVIDSTVAGHIGKGRAILRSTAKVGHSIFISGTIGGAAGGLKMLANGRKFSERSSENDKSLLLKQLHPQPHVELGILLNQLKIAMSMVDVSDGLSSDLAHLCRSSQVGACIAAESLPINPLLFHEFPPNECLEMGLNGGEDFELLFTVSKENCPHLESFDVTEIGEITANAGVVELCIDGNIEVLHAKGFRHF